MNRETDLNLTAGWGHAGKGGVTMPGKGKAIERDYTPDEIRNTQPELRNAFGAATYDIYMNENAYWQNIPSRVWDYTVGGYQVIKKWLSYREHGLLGRSLTVDEVREVMNIARRIAAILLLEPALDANHCSAKSATYPWPAK